MDSKIMTKEKRTITMSIIKMKLKYIMIITKHIEINTRRKVLSTYLRTISLKDRLQMQITSIDQIPIRKRLQLLKAMSKISSIPIQIGNVQLNLRFLTLTKHSRLKSKAS